MRWKQGEDESECTESEQRRRAHDIGADAMILERLATEVANPLPRAADIVDAADDVLLQALDDAGDEASAGDDGGSLSALGLAERGRGRGKKASKARKKLIRG